MSSLSVAKTLRAKLLTPPAFVRKRHSSHMANPYSRKMGTSLCAYHVLEYSLWIELEFDRAVVSFNLEPPAWSFGSDADQKDIVINAASLDVNDRVTLHFSKENLKRFDGFDKKIKASPEWGVLNGEIKVWNDLSEVRRLDRANKDALLRYLCAPELVVNAQIEKAILCELSDVRKLCVWDFVNKLKEHDPEEVKTAIANLVVGGKIFLDMSKRFTLSSDVSLREIF